MKYLIALLLIIGGLAYLDKKVNKKTNFVDEFCDDKDWQDEQLNKTN